MNFINFLHYQSGLFNPSVHPTVYFSIMIMEVSIFNVAYVKVFSRPGESEETNYECVSESFRTGRLERELQIVELSATRCTCIAIL
jgi:hypothetical protein